MGEKSGCATCSRIFLSLENILLMLAGLCVIGLSLWLWFDDSFEEEIRRNIKAEYSNNADMDNIKKDIRKVITISFWVLCGCGLAAAVIGLIGTCGALCGNRCITAFYLVLIILLLLIEVGIGVFIICYRTTLHNGIERYVQLSYQQTMLPDMQTLRNRYNCCGIDGYNTGTCSGLSQPTCTAAVWDQFNFSLMIAGFVTIGVVALQILAVILAISIIVTASSRS